MGSRSEVVLAWTNEDAGPSFREMAEDDSVRWVGAKERGKLREVILSRAARPVERRVGVRVGMLVVRLVDGLDV
jgi:hypothetical protein